MLTTKVALTLLLYFTVSICLASPDLHRRSGHQRLVKKRSPFPQGAIPVIGAEADPGTTSTSASQSLSTPPTQPTTTTANQVSSTPPAAATTTSSPTATLAQQSTTESASTVSSSSATLSSPSSTTVVPTPSTTTTSDGLNISALPPATFGDTSEVPVFSTATAAAATQSATTPASGSAKHTTITVLIVIAAGVGGVALIWTIIRKWKFRPSSQFEDRMQPIDWQPTGAEEGGAAHRRASSNASSFLSGSGHEHFDNMAGRGIGGGGYGATSDITPSVAPIPDHDFTAGPANLAPVGGYADLARGTSPRPQMQEALARGPSVNKQHYDQYGAPPQYAQDSYDYNGRAAF